MNPQNKNQATLFGVSVGPGDPQLLTLGAARAIAQCPVVACVQTEQGSTLALDIAAQAVDLHQKQLLRLPFLMTRDPAALAARHEQLAAALLVCLQAGRDVALLTLGDVALYSTFWAVAQRLRGQCAVRAVAGVPSFCAAAALLGEALTGQNIPLQVLPAGMESAALEAALDAPGTKVLMKSGAALPALLRLLKKKGLLERSALVQSCGLPEQRVVRNLCAATVGEIANDYFSLIIVRG